MSEYKQNDEGINMFKVFCILKAVDTIGNNSK